MDDARGDKFAWKKGDLKITKKAKPAENEDKKKSVRDAVPLHVVQLLNDGAITSVTLRQQTGLLQWRDSGGPNMGHIVDGTPTQQQVDDAARQLRAMGVEVKLTGPTSGW